MGVHLVVFSFVLLLVGSGWSGGSELLAVIGDHQSDYCWLVTIDSDTGLYKEIKYLSPLGGNLGMIRVSWKDSAIYTIELSNDSNGNFAYKLDLEGNLIGNISTPLILMTMDSIDQSLLASLTIHPKTYARSVALLDFSKGSVSNPLSLNKDWRIDNIGLSTYVQASHMIVTVVATSQDAPMLTFIDTQAWKVSKQVSWPFNTITMAYDDVSLSLIHAFRNLTTQGVDIVRTSLSTMQSETLWTYKGVCCSGDGASVYDSSSGLYYIALYAIGMHENFLATLDTKARKSINSVSLDYWPYGFVLNKVQR